MKLNVNLKWKELCKETGHEEWAKIQQQKSRIAKLKLILKEVNVIKSARTYYMIIDDKPAPVVKKFVYQQIEPNQRYGKLTVIEKIKDEGSKTTWKCLCDCGNTTETLCYNLISGTTKSCGCLFIETVSKANFTDAKRISVKNLVSFEENSEIFAIQQRRLLTPKLRYKILLRDNFHCCCCGQGVEDGAKLHVDHIIPISKGGKTTEDNLQTLCKDCNLGKGSIL